MKKRRLQIKCENGLHLRVAAELVKRVQLHKSDVTLSCKNCPRANACSIIELLKLGLEKREEVIVYADGEDAEQVLESIDELFSDGAGI